MNEELAWGGNKRGGRAPVDSIDSAELALGSRTETVYHKSFVSSESLGSLLQEIRVKPGDVFLGVV
jgi:hypothetical protein